MGNVDIDQPKKKKSLLKITKLIKLELDIIVLMKINLDQGLLETYQRGWVLGE